MRTRVMAASVLAALALLSAGCGDDGDGEKPAISEDVSIPDADGTSATFAVPLPDGATLVSSDAGTDVYRAEGEQQLMDLQYFYDRELSGKPFRGFDWCGGSGDYANTQVQILWRRTGTNDLFKLLLDARDPAGVLITASEEPGAPEVQCPPGPIDEVPNYDPGDIPGV